MICSVKAGFLKAIEKCGALFAENFPLESTEPGSVTTKAADGVVNPDELPNHLVILEE